MERGVCVIEAPKNLHNPPLHSTALPTSHCLFERPGGETLDFFVFHLLPWLFTHRTLMASFQPFGDAISMKNVTTLSC